MRVGATSDLHGHLPPYPDEQLDLMIVAGDVGAIRSPGGDPYGELAAWIEEAGCPVVGIAGNMDFDFIDAAVPEALPWTYLEDETTEFGGLLIHGSPWTPSFAGCFQLPEERLAHHWAMIPEATEILVTHGPARGTGDLVSGEHVGSESLAEAIGYMGGLRLHVFGHIHSGFGRWKVNGSIRANVSHVGAGDLPANPIQVFEL